MPNEPDNRRRFITWMLLALIPIFIGLFYVATMQCSKRTKLHASSDRSTVGNSFGVSYWGGDYQYVLRLWDSESGRQIADWKASNELLDRFWLSPNGQKFFRVEKFDEDGKAETNFYPGFVSRYRVVVGHVADGLHSQIVAFDLAKGAGTRDIHWADDGQRLIYRGVKGELRSFDVTDEWETVIRWDRPSTAGTHYWHSDNTLIWFNQRPISSERSYQLVGDELLSLGEPIKVDLSIDFYRFFSDGTRVITSKWTEGLKTCKVVDLATRGTVTTIESDGRPVSFWSAGNETVTCFYGDQVIYNDGEERITAAQVFDARTGQLLHETSLSERPAEIQYVESQDRFFVTKENREIAVIDLSGRKTVIAPALTRWWWPARAFFIALAFAWWLVWSQKLRRPDRSIQPVIDIAILHAIVFICSGARLWAYVYGPDWNKYLHVWESVIFLGTGLSIVTWFLVWIVFGPQRWPVRVAGLVFGISIVVMTIVLIWDAGSDAGNYDSSLALAQTLTGALTQLSVQLGLLWLAYLLKVRLVHRRDAKVADLSPSKRHTSIRDLFIWLVAFGVLFTIIQLRTMAMPEADNLTEILMSGCVAATIGVLTLWLGLGTQHYRLLIVLAGYAGAWWFYDAMDRMRIMHVGAAWLPMLLMSSAVLRWNGYTWQRSSAPRSGAGISRWSPLG